MRQYAKLGPTFWTGGTGRELRRRGSEALLVALYLVSSPHSNMLGLYYQPRLYMAHETGLGIEGASKGLQHCIDSGFCSYDDDTEMVFVFEMAAWQVADDLKATDKRCAGIQKDYESLPNNPFLSAWFDRYAEAFHLSRRRSFEAPKPEVAGGAPQAPSMPLRSQEQEQEQEQEHPLTPKRGPSVAGFPPGFEEFWGEYPKKTGKDAAAKAFAKRRVSVDLLAVMLRAVVAQRSWDAWTKEGGRFIPNPATWLNQGRWQDQPPSVGGGRSDDVFAGAR